MNIPEQRIREFAYQIWESEGKPHGQTERHWEMARKLAVTHASSDQQQAGSTEPIEPISPTQPAQPVPPSDPIQPTDPVQPGTPVQPGAPVAEVAKPKRTRAKAAEKQVAAGSEHAAQQPVNVKKPAAKKPAKPKKTNAYESETV